eukprot:TRINITY_DN106163_c0_g1_i1.p1 TRINITY_DN106163_c0_g1~~TRINITY_DN106163_c0_g1_i1.p1  ORF type:complete len:298 (+),score=36.85 TRINITY_DN106163_c0_g1_i1:98-991(+)
MQDYIPLSPWEAAGSLRGLVLATASSYPVPILLGNVVWAATYMRLHYAPKPMLFSLVFSFVFLGYPGNILANLVALGRVPSAFTNPRVFPAHLCAWLLVNFSPRDIVFRCCSKMQVFVPLSFVAGLDNMSTALQFIMHAYNVHPTNPVVQAILAGVLMNLGGAVSRHFEKYGWDEGSSMIDTFWPDLRVSLLCTASFYCLAVMEFPRDGDPDFPKRCAEASIWYETISIVGGANACFPCIRAFLDAVYAALKRVMAPAAAAAGLVYHHQTVHLKTLEDVHSPSEIQLKDMTKSHLPS